MRKATSFSRAEIDVACQVFHELFRGGDVTVLLRRGEGRSLISKFMRMQTKLRTEFSDETEQKTASYSGRGLATGF